MAEGSEPHAGPRGVAGGAGRDAGGADADAGTAAEPALRVLRIDHVGIAVADVDEAVERFRSLFGLVVRHREINHEQAVDEAVLVSAVRGAGTGAAPGPDGADGARAGTADPARGVSGVQFVAPVTASSTVATFLDRRGAGLHHLALTVADVTAAAEALRARGVRVLYDEARRGTAGSRITFLHPADVGGVLVELVQPAVHQGDSIIGSDD